MRVGPGRRSQGVTHNLMQINIMNEFGSQPICTGCVPDTAVDDSVWFAGEDCRSLLNASHCIVRFYYC